jgi:TonB family protein
MTMQLRTAIALLGLLGTSACSGQRRKAACGELRKGLEAYHRAEAAYHRELSKRLKQLAASRTPHDTRAPEDIPATYNQAVASFRRAVELDPQWARAHLYLATALARQFKEPGWFGSGTANSSHATEAITEFRKALEINAPSAGRDNVAAGAILYVALGKEEEAKEWCQRWSGVVPGASLCLAAAFAEHYIPGFESPENVRFAEQVVQESQKVLESDPKNAESAALIAGMYMSMRKQNEARRWYQRQLEVEPSSYRAHYALGVMDWQEAYNSRAMVKAQQGVPPEEPLKDRRVQRKLCAKNLPLADASIRQFSRAMELRTDYYEAMAYLSLVYRERAECAAEQPARAADVREADQWWIRSEEARRKRFADEPVAPKASPPKEACEDLPTPAAYRLSAFTEAMSEPPPPPPPPPPGGYRMPHPTAVTATLKGMPSEPPPTPTVTSQQPPRPAAKRVRVPATAQQARLVKRAEPAYPPLAKHAGIQDTVRLEMIVLSDGSVGWLKLLSGHPLLVHAATDAVRQWRYQPAVEVGQAVEVETTVEVKFSLNP